MPELVKPVGSVCGEEPAKAAAGAAPTTQQARKAAERGLDFVVKDVVKWRTDKNCATCHHGTMTVWTLAEAKSQGYPVAAETFADRTTWGATQGQPPDQPAATGPGVGLWPERRTAVMTSREPVRADLWTAGDEGDEPGQPTPMQGGLHFGCWINGLDR